MDVQLHDLKNEMQAELHQILGWWNTIARDDINGGFIGKVSHQNEVFPESPKGAVLNARILWAFSAANYVTGNEKYLAAANRAFDFFIDHFIDKEFGGVYWTVDHKGEALDTKKQTYAIAFGVYGLGEYYKCSGNENAKQAAIGLYHDIMDHCYEKKIWRLYRSLFAGLD